MRVTIGRYPAIGLSEARDQARIIIDRASRGIDPRQKPDGQAIARRGAPTLGEVADDFLSMQVERVEKANSLDRRVLRPSTLRDYRRMLTIVAEPLRKLQIEEVSRRDVKRIVDELEN